MKVLYQSSRYKPERVKIRYLHINLASGKPVVDECDAVSGLTLRCYELPPENTPRYSRAIAAAEKIKLEFPYSVELQEDPQ